MTQPDLFGPLAQSNARIARETAAMRRDVGIARAAKRQSDAWTERAVGYVMEYVVTHREPFLAENVRAYALERDGFKADQPKAWGQVMRNAAKLGVVRKVGYAPASSSNLAPKCLWSAA